MIVSVLNTQQQQQQQQQQQHQTSCIYETNKHFIYIN